MKSSLRAALAVGVLALASSQAFAVSVPVFTGMTPVQVGTTNLAPGLNPNFYELVVTGSGPVSTVITLVDTTPEVQTVSYDIFLDTDPTAGIAIGAAVDSWSFVDILGTPTQSHTTLLAASMLGTQYVLKMVSSGLGIAEGSTSQISAVPLPAAAWLFGSALLGLGALRRKQKAGNSEMAAV